MAASLLLAQGVPLRVVMEILSHCQIGLTADTYSHVAPEVQAAAERMDDLLRRLNEAGDGDDRATGDDAKTPDGTGAGRDDGDGVADKVADGGLPGVDDTASARQRGEQGGFREADAFKTT